MSELEIACDESGYEGEKLIGTTTDLFAHASVRLDIAVAEEFMAELRSRIRSPATEYKANHVLREKHRRVLRWLLGPDAPLRGNVNVFLIDKAYFVFGKLLDPALYHEARQAFRPADWSGLLTTANDLMRDKDSAHRTELDPLIPAVVRAVARWGPRPVSIVHDRQNTFTPERIARIHELCAGGLAQLRLGDSSVDARIQVADIAAGAVRKIASDELHGHGDPELTALLPPYVDKESILSMH
jgi:hypothetical protein